MLIAQLSDPHVKGPGQLLYDRIDTAGYLERAVAHVLRLDPLPDVVIMTGDLVDGGKAEEYALLRRLLAPLPMPVYVIPGNHDAREPLRAAFADKGLFPGRGLPAVRGRGPAGAPDRARHAGRGQALRRAVRGAPGLARGPVWASRRDKPVMLFMHHPPFECGIDAFDHVAPAARRRAAGRAGAPARQLSSARSAATSIGRSRCAGPAPWPRSRPAPPIRRHSICTSIRRSP